MATYEVWPKKVGFFIMFFSVELQVKLPIFRRKFTGPSAPYGKILNIGCCNLLPDLTRVENRIQIGWSAAERKPYI